jgi:eukaryotic-like serine/threonine-protein kinase
MTLAPGTKLGPYEILASLGAGGMGEVWKARDSRLGRIVAIKKVKEQHSERFKQEARTIAALNHPYICQLHDIGPDYLVLEYVNGKPLSSPMPEREAVRLAIQIATALEAAHKKGIIHRDLKPANIMVTEEGLVKLLDFGLAKLYEQDLSISASPTADFPATQAGAILGTVTYMSPEQAQGQPADARSDIFSFGLVLYEMLSGRRAFAGDSNYAVMDAIVKRDPPALQTSPGLGKVVQKCLAKQPWGRYQTISEVKTALEQVFGEKEASTSSEPQPSIAVLPFVNMSGDKEQEYFSDGLAEEIINALTQIPGLKVIARTSSFSFRGKEQDIRRIAETLNVKTILEGSVRRAGNRLRVTAQLIDAVDGSHFWSERYDREMADVFAIQDEISQAIADKLRVKLTGAGALVKRFTGNIEAFNLCLKGNYFLYKSSAESILRSREFFERSIAIDPDCELAWYGLANFYFNMGFLGYMQPKTANAESRRAAQRALGLNENIAEAHSILGSIHATEFNWRGAEREFKRALEISPRSAQVLTSYSLDYLMPMQRTEDALDAAAKALELDPTSPWRQWYLGYCYFLARQWGRTVEQCEHTLELDANFYLAHQYLGFVYLLTGKVDEGIQACETAARLVGNSTWAMVFRAMALAWAGRIDEAHRFITAMEDVAQKAYVSPSMFAWVYCSLEETEKGLEWFEKAIDECDGLIIHGHLFPIYDPLRSHPRYKALLRKMNLKP